MESSTCLSALTCLADTAPVSGEVPPLLSWASLVSLITLSVLEIVLGIDNVIVIAITTSKLDPNIRFKIQRLGIALAIFVRIMLLCSISWIMSLTKPLFAVGGHEFSGRDLVLLIGGLFLIAKATHEIHEKLEPNKREKSDEVGDLAPAKPSVSIPYILIQILLIDIIFSLDSVITAVGMSNQLPVMITAVIIASLVMMIFSKTVSEFVEKHPTMKVLALAFLILIGAMLVGESVGQHIPKGYLYFAMAFALGVESVNIRMRKHGQANDPG